MDYTEYDESGKVDWGAFPKSDFDKHVEPDKGRYGTDKSRVNFRMRLLLVMISDMKKNKAKYKLSSVFQSSSSANPINCCECSKRRLV